MMTVSMTVPCTEVSGVENIGQCGRLSQLSSAGFWAHFNIVTYLMIMIMTSGWGLQHTPTSPITKNTVH